MHISRTIVLQKVFPLSLAFHSYIFYILCGINENISSGNVLYKNLTVKSHSFSPPHLFSFLNLNSHITYGLHLVPPAGRENETKL